MFAIQDSPKCTTQIYPIPSMGILRQKRQAAGSAPRKSTVKSQDVELRDEEPRFGIWNALLPQTALDWHSVMLQSKIFQRYMHSACGQDIAKFCRVLQSAAPLPTSGSFFSARALATASLAPPLAPAELGVASRASLRWRRASLMWLAAHSQSAPRGSPLMSKAYIWLISTVNVRKFTLHGWYGYTVHLHETQIVLLLAFQTSPCVSKSSGWLAFPKPAGLTYMPIPCVFKNQSVFVCTSA